MTVNKRKDKFEKNKGCNEEEILYMVSGVEKEFSDDSAGKAHRYIIIRYLCTHTYTSFSLSSSLSHNYVQKMNSHSRNHQRLEQNMCALACIRVCSCVCVFWDRGLAPHRCWGASVNGKSSPLSPAFDDLKENQRMHKHREKQRQVIFIVRHYSLLWLAFGII